MPAAELEAEREQQRRDQIGEVDARQVLGEIADRLQHAVDLPAEVDRAERHLVKLSRLAVAPSRWTVLAPTLLAAALAAAYMICSPASQDLAAATFRADLFADHGFVIWNNDWYSGHYVLSYSVLYPPLGALLGPRLVGALAVVAAAALFALLARRRFGARALIPSLWFAAAIGAWLLTGRIPFLLAVPFGLGALLAADSGRSVSAALLATLASLASPVAGLFVALAGVAIALAGDRVRGAALAIGGAAPIAVLNLAFPVPATSRSSSRPSSRSRSSPRSALWLVPTEFRALRIGVALYALLALAVFVIPNALGGNVTRLGALFAGPVLALALWPRGRLVVIAVSIPLLYWQLLAPVRDVDKAAGDPSTELAFYEPLLAELDRLAASEGPFRTEIPPTKNRFEAAYVARGHPIARGWLRQLESDDFDLFTDGELTAGAYLDWLRRHGVSYVAVPEAPRDYLAEDEVALIDAGLGYLAPVWSDDDWRLYRVAGSQAWGLDGLGVEAIGADGFTVDPAPDGPRPTSIEWTPLWSVTGGAACVSEGEDGGTLVEPRPGSGPVTVETELGGDACSG